MVDSLSPEKFDSLIRSSVASEAKYHWMFDKHQSGSGGICVEDGSILQFSSAGLSFLMWIQVNQGQLIEHGRHLLYRLKTSSKSFLEAFLAKDGTLIVAVMTDKMYITSLLVEKSLNDGKWHSVIIVHAVGRSIMSSTQLRVYVDGEEQHVANMKLPKGTSAHSLHIGAIGDPTSQTFETLAGRNEGLRTFQGFGLSQTTSSYFSLPVGLRSFDPRNSSVRSVGAGLEDYVWGPVRPFPGKVAAFAFFREPLNQGQCKRLNTAGPTFVHIYSCPLPSNMDITSRCRYAITASASDRDCFLELSSRKLISGKTSMTLITSERVEEMLFSSGGIMALIPILSELITKRRETVPDLLSDASVESPVNEIAKYFETLAIFFFQYEQYHVGAIQQKFFEIVGVVVGKIRTETIDGTLLEAVQMLEQSFKLHDELRRAFLLNILCNFKIWKKAKFHIRLSHLEYLTTLVRQDRRFFRHRFGVQSFLDALRQHFSIQDDPESITLRSGVLRIIRFFLERDPHFAEVDAVLRFIYALTHEYLVGEVLEMLYTALESRKCSDQLYLLLFESKCAELLYGILPEHGADVMTSVLKVLHTLLKCQRIYAENKSRLYLHHCGFGGFFSAMKRFDWTEKSAEYFSDCLLSNDFPETSFRGFLVMCTKLTSASAGVKLIVAKKLLDHLVSVQGAAKMFSSQVDWVGCILRLLVKQGSGEIIPIKCRTPSTLSFSAPSTPLPPQHPFAPLGERLEVLLGLQSKQAVVSGSRLRTGFHWMRLRQWTIVLMPVLTASKWRKAVVKWKTLPVTEIALRPFITFFSVTPSSLSFEMSLPSENSKVHIKDMEQVPFFPSEDACVEEHLLLVTTSIGLILSKGLESPDPWKEAWKTLSSVDILTEANIFYHDPKRIKTQLIAVFGQSAVRWLREDQSPSKALQVLKWLYAATELGADSEGSYVILELGLQIMDMFGILTEGFDARKAPGMTEVLHVSIGLLVFYVSSPLSEVCSLSCARLHQFLNSRGGSMDNQMISFILYQTGTFCTNVVFESQERLYVFVLPLVKTLLQLSGAATFLPSIFDSDVTIGPNFYEDFKSLAKTSNWNRYLNDLVRESSDRFHAIYLSSLELQLRQLSADCNEEAAVAWHLHCRQVGESKLKFSAEILVPLQAERDRESSRFQLFCMKQKRLQVQYFRRWQELKEKLLKPSYPIELSDLHWTQSERESFCRRRPIMALNKSFVDHLEASKLRDETGPLETKTETSLFQIPKKESGGFESQDSEEDIEAEELPETDEVPVGTQGKVFKPVECERITIFGSVKGSLQVSESFVNFSGAKKESIEIPVWMLREVYSRRYCLQRTAMEIFLLDNTNYFFNFKDKIANQVYIQIRSLRPPNLVSKYSFDVVRRNQLTQQWQRREISNFDYLMALNTASGRTFSDLAQYPVMPWILSDYTSKELNFEDFGIYREFSKPVGAQSAKNRLEIKTKYETFEDPTGLVPKFHYGSHYSSPAVVAHYLVRVEPFTSLHVDLQGGKFDLADRQFVSIPSAWRSLQDSPSDVKELIPELFTTPDLLRNKNRFDLGKLQGSDEAVNDVVLPPWATSPEDFVAKHREALECEYVSRNLHSWINLIFGNKQKGPQAVDALNVFYYSSYEDAVNLELITDEMEKMAVAEMIRHFGQTPIQLFRFPHPPRLPLEELKPLFAKNGSIRRPSIADFPNCRISYVQSMNEGSETAVWLAFPQRARTLLSPPQNNDPWNLFSVSADRRCFIYKLHGNVKSTLDREEISSRLEAQRHLPICFHPAITVSSEIFALTPDGKFMLAGGSWDSNLMVFSVAAGKEVRLEHTLVGHAEPVTCISSDRIGLYCVSGSKDTTCIIWSISELVGLQPSRDPVPKQIHVLIGHRTPLVAVAISTELDVVVSASSDGTVLVHSVKTGIYQWAISPFQDLPSTVSKLSVGEEGDVVIVTQKGSEYSIVSSTLNGKILASLKLQHRPTVLVAGRQHLLIGDVAGNLEMRKTWSLTRVLHFAFPEPITSAAVTPAWTHFIVSLKDGTMVVVEPDLKIRKTPSVLNV